MRNVGNQPIYLDYNATTPLAPEVVEVMRPFLEREFGNPSSSHHYGEHPRQAVTQAREQVAALIGAKPEDIVFTSGGTESNNYAIIGTVAALKSRGSHVITTNIEHPAVANTCAALEARGFEVTRLAVDEQGIIDPGQVEAAVRPDTILVSVMHANNEIGTIEPIGEIAEIARRYGAVVHTDAAQSLGKIPVDLDKLGVDLLTVAGHKLYAPKGVGALYVREGIALEPILYGGGQENGQRPGTENVLEIVGLGEACRIAARDLSEHARVMRETRDLLHRRLRERCNVRLNGHPEARLPNTLNVGFRGVRSGDLLSAVSDTLAASAGSACHSETVTLSPVIEALGVPREYAEGAVRFSTGRFTTTEDVERTAAAIAISIGK